MLTALLFALLLFALKNHATRTLRRQPKPLTKLLSVTTEVILPIVTSFLNKRVDCPTYLLCS